MICGNCVTKSQPNSVEKTPFLGGQGSAAFPQLPDGISMHEGLSFLGSFYTGTGEMCMSGLCMHAQICACDMHISILPY